MKILCPLSGIQWEAEGFVTGHRRLELMHPIFYSDLRSLVARESDWQAGRLSEEEKKLLFLATLNYSDLIDWHHAAIPSIRIVEQNYLHLLKLIVWREGVQNPRMQLPRFAIHKENCKLENFHFWMVAWEDAKKSFESGIREQKRQEVKLKLEGYLDRRILAVAVGTQKETEKYLAVLANWADAATDFPRFELTNPVTKQQQSLSGYWKEIICASKDKIWRYPVEDIKELEEHLIDNLEDLSSLYAGALFRRVRRMISKQTTDLGLELIELPESEQFPGQRQWTVVNSDIAAQQALDNLRASAPESEPKECDYPTKAKYLLAKIAWNVSKRHSK